MAIRKKTPSSGLRVTTDSTGKIIGASDSKGSYSVDSSGKATLTSSSTPKPTRYTQPRPLPTSSGQVAASPITPAFAKPTLQPVNEKAIRDQTRKRMQSSIDAINANYANLISQEKVQAQDRSGQTRALNARSGTIGSDFGQAAQEKTTQYNKQQQQYLVDQQNAQVTSVMQNIEDRASAEIQSRKNEALGKYQMELGEFDKAQEQARGDFALLAKSGADLNSFNPAQKAALFRQAGYDDTWGDLIYNAMKPKNRIEYKFEKLADGRGLFYGVDPLTGELVTKDVNVDLPPDWDMQIAPDGTILGYDKNTGEARVLSGKGEFGKPEDSSDALLTPEQAEQLGVPYGTTKQGAFGSVPGQSEKAQAAENSLTNINTVLGLIDTITNHPGLKSATGTSRLRTAIPGSNARDFVAKFDQLKALLSLDNIKYLKGTGAISDAEQQLLANAASALRRDIGTDDFVAELDRLQGQLSTTQEKLQNVINTGSNSLLQEFEAQFGGSEGANPKAQSSNLSVNTKKLASAILPKFPQGSVGGQCVTFLHKLAEFPSVGDGKKDKFASVDRFGIPKQQVPSTARVGMILITGENKTYGHGAMINSISADGKYARLTESNYQGNERVTHNRVIALTDPQIYGAIVPKKLNSIA